MVKLGLGLDAVLESSAEIVIDGRGAWWKLGLGLDAVLESFAEIVIDGRGAWWKAGPRSRSLPGAALEVPVAAVQLAERLGHYTSISPLRELVLSYYTAMIT